MSLDLITYFSCAVCGEFLLGPVTLPCGYTVCKSCFELSSKVALRYSISDDLGCLVPDAAADSTLVFPISYQQCPVEQCRKRHLLRIYKTDCLVAAYQERMFPSVVEAQRCILTGLAELSKIGFASEADTDLVSSRPLWSDARNLSPFVISFDPCSKILPPLQHTIERVIETHFDKAVRLAPSLQAAYLARGSARAIVGHFSLAASDVLMATQLNPGNNKFEALARKIPILSIAPYVCPSITVQKLPMTSSSSSTCSTSSTSSTSCSSAPVWNDCKRPVSDIDIECTLCFNTLYQPITTPCGHTWCRPCLLRAVEVKPSCPCCRQSLPSYGCMQGRHPNRILTRILESFFSKTIEMRSLTSNQELPDRRLVVPIFVGSLALPGIPCFMRIFEERYRKMIQSCIGKDGIFGMCLPIRNRRCASDRNYSEFGTLLKIRNYQPVYPSDPQYQQENALPLYIVEAVGSHRFRVVEELSCEDGYCRAVIERVDDITEDEDDDDLDNNDAEPSSQSKQLVSKSSCSDFFECPVSALFKATLRASNWPCSKSRLICKPLNPSDPMSSSESDPALGRRTRMQCTISRAKAYVERRLRSMECNQRRHFERLHGPCPNDVGMLSFWLANVIPMDVYEKYSILPITSSQKRLEAVSTWLEKYLVVEECS